MKPRHVRTALPCWVGLLSLSAGALVCEFFASTPVASPTTPRPSRDAPLTSTRPGTPGLIPDPASHRPAAVAALATSGTTTPRPAGAGMTVVGILGGTARVAIIRAGRETFIARVGEPIDDTVVVAILPTKVVLKKDKTTFELPAPSTARAPLVLAATPGSTPPPPPAGTGMAVTGILEGTTRVAIIRAGRETFIAKVGEPVGPAIVVAISPTKVVLKQDKTTFELPAPSTARPPLVPAATPGSTPPPSPGTGMIVTGILEGTTRVAIIRAGGKSFIARVGDPVDGAVVVAILSNKVVVKKNGTTSELRIGGKPSI